VRVRREERAGQLKNNSFIQLIRNQGIALLMLEMNGFSHRWDSELLNA